MKELLALFHSSYLQNLVEVVEIKNVKKSLFFFLKVRERKKIILFEHKNFKQQTIVQCKLIIVKNTVRGLKEPVMFDDIQGYSCVGVCFVVVSETDDTIIVFRSFSPTTVC